MHDETLVKSAFCQSRKHILLHDISFMSLGSDCFCMKNMPNPHFKPPYLEKVLPDFSNLHAIFSNSEAPPHENNLLLTYDHWSVAVLTVTEHFIYSHF